MAIYAVHSPIGGAPDKVAFVREGFSWSAFALGWMWALAHRLWVSAAILFTLDALLALGAAVLGVIVTAAIGVAINLIFGFGARDLQANALTRRGMPEVGLSEGQSLEEAELRYFHGVGARMAVPAPARAAPYAPHADPLGLFGNG
ncbi:DUF2628 domain-containing protein [Aestuariivirga sp.]|uniref:DUF2628 domain-containing protein n=1 Tax=Aestuariivirga sp. TaxID=2650926 RepID=UPI0039E6401C